MNMVQCDLKIKERASSKASKALDEIKNEDDLTEEEKEKLIKSHKEFLESKVK